MSGDVAPTAAKTVLVGVTGGIAAYKTCDVVSRLVKLGHSVYVIMTEAATKFVTPLTFQTLSGNPVFTTMFDPPKLWNVEHVALADRADAVLVAPATANFVAKLAAGICDDLLTTVLCACRAPVLICPAMNHNMYASAIYQANEARLRALGYNFLAPGYGRLASGAVGLGRLPEPPRIVQALFGMMAGGGDYPGIDVLVTAGPTWEFFDPVRFLGNPSSGRMGFAVAAAAAARGGKVTLVTGPAELPDPPGVSVIRVVSATEMLEAARSAFHGTGLVVAAAAVSDYRPSVRIGQKIKKGPATLEVFLERTPDVLAELSALNGSAVLVGFAAETEELLGNAKRKLADKRLDLVVANDLNLPGAAFRGETNRATLVWADGTTEERPLESKRQLAEHILTSVLPLVAARGRGGGVEQSPGAEP
jgi:phosphopantothenoylcysteine decarboxylase/phosphopantothenate--cysteine ligase